MYGDDQEKQKENLCKKFFSLADTLNIFLLFSIKCLHLIQSFSIFFNSLEQKRNYVKITESSSIKMHYQERTS